MKHYVTSHVHLICNWIIASISFFLVSIAQEDTPDCSWFQFFDILMNIGGAPKIFGSRLFFTWRSTSSCDFCNEVQNSITLDGVRFMRYVAERTASPQYFCGIFMLNSDALTISRICMFRLSTSLFCCGVITHEFWCCISFSLQNLSISLLMYSLPLSNCRLQISFLQFLLIGTTP